MWILTVSGTAGVTHKRQWLQPGHEYKIGRSPKNDLVLDKKFISSSHLTLVVGNTADMHKSNPTPLRLQLDSNATTYIDQKRYRYDAKTDPIRPRSFELTKNTPVRFQKGEESIDLLIDWVPIALSYSAHSATQCLSTRDPELTIEQLAQKVLQKFDFRISTGVRSTTNCYLKSTPHDIADLAYSLLHLIPVIGENFLWDLLDKESAIKQDFDSFPQMQEYPAEPQLQIVPERQHLFADITFVTTDSVSAQLFRPLVEDAGGVLTVVPEHQTSSSASAWLDKTSKNGKLVMIQFVGLEKLKTLVADEARLGLLDELCSLRDRKLCRGEDLLQAITHVDTLILFGSYVKRKPETQAGNRRKRRVLGTQTRLDPLELYLSSSLPVVEPDSYILKLGPEPTLSSPVKRISRAKKIDPSSLFDEYSKAPVVSVSSAKKTPAFGHDEDVVMDSEPEEQVLTSQPPVSVSSTQDPHPTRKEKTTTYKLNLQQLKKEIDEEVSSERSRSKNLFSETSKSSTKFIDAIKQIKTEKKLVEEERLISGADLEGLNIQDLIIVESIDVVNGSSNAANIVSGQSWNPQWNGRKNFKTFQKVLPKSLQNGRNHIVSTSVWSTSASYLPMEEFKEGEEEDQDELFFAKTRQREDEQYRRQFELEESQHDQLDQDFPNSTKKSVLTQQREALFVESDDEDDEREFQTAATSSFAKFRARSQITSPQKDSRPISAAGSREKRSRRGKSIESDDDDDGDEDDDDEDDERGLKFKFTRRL